MGANTRSGKELKELKEVIENAISPLRDEIAQLPNRQMMNMIISEALSGIEAKFEERLAQNDEKVRRLEVHIDLLENKLERIGQLEQKIDDAEQYSRRVCLRFDNIDLPPVGDRENCANKAGKILDELNCGVSEESIDRAHRIGRKFTDKKGVTRQQVIVKFKSFKDRTTVYRNRKKLQSQVRIRVDLTKRRLGLLNEAKDQVRADDDRLDFAFADINCNLAVKTKSGKLIFFNSCDELKSKLASEFIDDCAVLG